VATADDLLLVAVSVPVSLEPAVDCAYCTVTLHDLLGPRLPVQVSEVFENADEPLSDTVRAPVADPPEFVSVYVFETLAPGSMVP
jgi:hypothetical protein